MKRNTTILLCLLAVFALVLTACAPTAPQDSPAVEQTNDPDSGQPDEPEPPLATNQPEAPTQNEPAAASATLQVVGEATIQVAPDTVYLNFEAQNTSKTATEAATQNAQLVDQIVSQLTRAGIPQENLSTAQYTLYPEYNYSVNPATLTGYRASTSLTVKVSDIDQAGKYIDTAIAAGASVSYGMSYALENDQETYRSAISQACQDAKAKADATAAANGKTVGDIISVSEGYTSSAVDTPYLSANSVAEGGAATTIYPSQVQVTAAVTIVYALI